jgi:hypothetical protein
MNPWELDSSQVEIVRSYETEIMGEDGDKYLIEFADKDGGMVEAKLPKKEFEGVPGLGEPRGMSGWQPAVGSMLYCGIVIYRMKGEKGLRVGIWPLASYWHPSLREADHED